MTKISIVRGELVQGKSVVVEVWEEDESVGEFILSFDAWILLNKVVKEGVENLAKKQELRGKVEIRGDSQLGKKQQEPKPKVSYQPTDEDVKKILGGKV